MKASDFPELARVFSGYLHEDFLEEYGTPEAALRAFFKDADSSERLRFRTEAQRFLDQVHALNSHDTSALIGRLGCRWTPPSREALTRLLQGAMKPHRGKKR